MKNIEDAYNEFNLCDFERKIGYIFHNRDLLVTALTRNSYMNENETSWGSNESLEFFGDCILQLIISQRLFGENSNVKDLTNRRRDLVSNKHISKLIQTLNIKDHLLLGKGERETVEQLGDDFWANLYESLVAAIYLDSSSLEAAKSFIDQLEDQHASYSQKYYADSLVKAIKYAFEAHSDQYRKGTRIPYIVHPMDVASILMKNEAPEKVVIAGLLHDVVEDTDTPIQTIEELFGVEVANLVKQASEPQELMGKDELKKRTWKARKEDTIAKIREFDYDSKLLSCADKLSNIRDMINDQQLFGDEFWGKFNASKQEQSWYYHSLLEAYAMSPPSIVEKPVFLQFKEAVLTRFQK